MPRNPDKKALESNIKKFYITEAGTCNVGRVETNDKCDSGNVCCKEDKAAYESSPDSFAIICGKDSIGVCSAESEFNPQIGSYMKKFPCGEGRVKIDDIAENCKGINGDKTPLCCAPLDTGTVSVGKAFSAKIPLIYKNEQAILEVSVE